MSDYKCIQCVGVNKNFLSKQALGMIPENAPVPQIKDAITLVPTWQQQIVGQQVVMACVAVPMCFEHMEVREMSAEERAVAGGRLLQARLDTP